MRIEHGKLEGDYRLYDDLALYGMIVGNVFVGSNICFLLHGMVTENVIVETNGLVEIYGTVHGHVYNRGGVIRIHGMVNGQIFSESGSTHIDPQAHVNN